MGQTKEPPVVDGNSPRSIQPNAVLSGAQTFNNAARSVPAPHAGAILVL